MSFEIIGFFITTVGELLLGYSVLRVHNTLEVERKVDEKVLNEVKKEKLWTVCGMVLIFTGFLVQIASERFI